MFFVIFAIINASALHTECRLLELALKDQNTLVPCGNFLPQLAKTRGLGANSTLFVHIVADVLLLGLLRHRYIRAMQKHSETAPVSENAS